MFDKFNPDGTVRTFPGCSIVTHLTPNTPVHLGLRQVQARLTASPVGRCFTPLPPSSFHMTVMDLVCDQVREPAYWSRQIPLDAPLAVVDARLALHVAKVQPAPGPLHMRIDRLGPPDVTVHVLVEPADSETRQALGRYRQAISRATGVRHPNHETYGFHISLAYRIAEMSEAEQRAYETFAAQTHAQLGSTVDRLTLDAPDLVFFDDMFSFPRQRR